MTLPDLSIGQKGHAGLHRSIRSRLLDVREYPSIQAAIDAASGEVLIPAGVWDVSQTITGRAGVNLILSHGATLRAVADVDIYRPAPRGGIQGGTLDCTLPGYSHAAILLDGQKHFYLQPTIIADVQINGGGTGTGIRFQAYQQMDSYPYVFGVVVRDFGIANFTRGIWMEIIEVANSEQLASINANQFGNGYFDRCRYAIYMDYIESAPSTLRGIGGNTFSNIQVQPDANSLRAVYCEGGHNLFINLFVWDWYAEMTGNNPAIELTTHSTRNLILTNLRSAYFANSGATNRFVTPDVP